MKKLIQGVVDFRKHIRPGYVEMFGKLALGQRPDTLFIACSDSRVVPNTFASSDPGDLFVIRNVGNIVPPSPTHDQDSSPTEAAAIEFAIRRLGVTEIIVCGHSECGAMQAALDGCAESMPHLQSWLRHAGHALSELQGNSTLGEGLAAHNRLSQFNVLNQIDNIASYPFVNERISAGQLRLHGWWFELKSAEVFSYEPDAQKFLRIDETLAAKILKRLGMD